MHVRDPVRVHDVRLDEQDDRDGTGDRDEVDCDSQVARQLAREAVDLVGAHLVGAGLGVTGRIRRHQDQPGRRDREPDPEKV